jgi:hypothetical protein
MSRYFLLPILVLAIVIWSGRIMTAGDDDTTADATSDNTAGDLAGTAATPSADADKHTDTGKHLLRYRFRKDEVVRSKVIQQTKIETTISGTTQSAEMTSISIKAWRVTNVADDGRVTFETMIEAVDMRQQMSGRQEVRYNSQTDKQAPPGYESAAASVGKHLTTIEIDAAGKLLRRDKIYQLGVDNLNALVVMPLPEQPIAIGEHWSVPIDVTVTLARGESKPMVVKNRYQLERVEKGVAVISVQTILPPVNDPRIRAQLVQRMTKGEIHFDLARGRVINQETNLDEQVIGFSGANSSLQYVGRFTEELLSDDAQAAGKATLKR